MDLKRKDGMWKLQRLDADSATFDSTAARPPQPLPQSPPAADGDFLASAALLLRQISSDPTMLIEPAQQKPVAQ